MSQSPYSMGMVPGGAMIMVPSNEPGGPPSYSTVCPPNMYPQYQYFSSHPGSGAGSQVSGGSGGSGSQKSGPSQKNPQRDFDQVTIRSSGSSERSHSSKGSKRKPVLDDRSSLSSFHSDTISLRSEIIAPDNRSISSHHGIQPMIAMPIMSTAPHLAQAISHEHLAQQMQQLQIHQHQQQLQQHLQQQQQQHQQQAGQQPATTQPGEQPRELGRLDTLPANMSASRQSFRMAMGNTSNEFFVDVM